MDVVTGATYMPHLTDTDVIANDGNGFKRFENLALIGNQIKNDKQIDGGVLGTPSNDLEQADHYAPEFMKGMLVMDNRIESTANRVIGGALGAWGSYGLVEGSAFINNSIKSGTSGVASGSAMAPNHIDTLRDSLFYGNSTVSTVSSGRGAVYLYSSDEEHSIDLMENAFFIKNTAQGASSYGGAISDRSINGLGIIKNSVFAFNEITTNSAGTANGGAIDAGSSAGATSGGGGINEITGSLFYGNKALTPGGTAYGGAIDMGTRSAQRDLVDWRSPNLTTTITDSRFLNNEATSNTGAAYGGAIMLETNGYTTAGTSTLKTVDFVATAGGETLFSGNKANGQANAIYVGQRSGGSSNFDAVFNMKPAAGGRVAFDDPITVSMNGGRSFTLNSSGQGTFYWNGLNDFSADGGSFVNFESGLNILGSDFTLTSSAAKDIFVSLEKPAVINVDLAGRNKNLALFDNVTELKSDQASLGLGSYMIGDFTGSWLLATGADLAGLYDFNHCCPVKE